MSGPGNLQFIRNFNEISIKDIPLVGGKTASIGEMYNQLLSKAILIPDGFAVTADAFTELIKENNLSQKIKELLSTLQTNDTAQLAQIGNEIRTLILNAQLPQTVANEIQIAYEYLCKKTGVAEIDVAVRSSATAEDLPEASFAGQQETYLNIVGADQLLKACQKCFASLYTDRAISYRASNNIDHNLVKLSICIQQMVRSDLASSGVAFTLDTESGARNVVLINSSYGLGENIVGGKVDPDEFLVVKGLLEKKECVPIIKRKLGNKQIKLVYSGHKTENKTVLEADQKKFSLTDAEVLLLSRWAMLIEQHYSKIQKKETPMDIEWAKDGQSNKIYILQARPETVHSQKTKLQTSSFVLNKYSKILTQGQAVGEKIGTGAVRIIRSVQDLKDFQSGEVLVAEMTSPDWEPAMKMASAIITDRGGRTCHAAIVSREHGVPCIVGTQNSTSVLKNSSLVTVSCAEGSEGFVYDGKLDYKEVKMDWLSLTKPKTDILVNIGNPAIAFKTSILPVAGVGLARMEFIISHSVKIHPMALIHLNKIEEPDVRNEIEIMLGEYKNNPQQYFVDKLSEGLALIAGAFYPRSVIIRFSDFKTNEYANLVGGGPFEPFEENPMIGFRGASRYYDDRYREAFALECKAIKKLRDHLGLTNIKVMVPFCRTPEEGEKVLLEMKKNRLVRGENNLQIYVMSELPSNIIAADNFSRLFDGFSIGSNDLTQMILAVDRDSTIVQHLFDERHPAVLKMISLAIQSAKKFQRPIGICGQAPSDYPEITNFLVKERIDSISVTPDAVHNTIINVLKAEKDLGLTQHYLHRKVEITREHS